MRRCVPVLLALLGGCSARAGMFCQEDAECSSGLICVFPLLDGGARAGAYGVCDEARRGRGELCLSPGECQAPLTCSNQLGVFAPDGRYGTCVEAPVAEDLAAPDLSVPDLSLPDLRPPPDGDGDAGDLGDAG